MGKKRKKERGGGLTWNIRLIPLLNNNDVRIGGQWIDRVC